MSLKYLRLRIFEVAIAFWSPIVRRRRMRRFAEFANLRSGLRILDLGGTPSIWRFETTPLDITLLNLPGRIESKAGETAHKFSYVDGDACDLSRYRDGEFDVVFSNSVIEHVGDFERMRQFAHEARRVAKSYWIQTPSRWFPIEPHCGMPFWWLYPARLRDSFLARWRPKLPDWTAMVASTTVLTKVQLRELFPEAAVRCEFWGCFPKSYYVSFRQGRPTA